MEQSIVLTTNFQGQRYNTPTIYHRLRGPEFIYRSAHGSSDGMEMRDEHRELVEGFTASRARQGDADPHARKWIARTVILVTPGRPLP